MEIQNGNLQGGFFQPRSAGSLTARDGLSSAGWTRSWGGLFARGFRRFQRHCQIAPCLHVCACVALQSAKIRILVLCRFSVSSHMLWTGVNSSRDTDVLGCDGLIIICKHVSVWGEAYVERRGSSPSSQSNNRRCADRNSIVSLPYSVILFLFLILSSGFASRIESTPTPEPNPFWSREEAPLVTASSCSASTPPRSAHANEPLTRRGRWLKSSWWLVLYVTNSLAAVSARAWRSFPSGNPLAYNPRERLRRGFLLAMQIIFQGSYRQKLWGAKSVAEVDWWREISIVMWDTQCWCAQQHVSRLI